MRNLFLVLLIFSSSLGLAKGTSGFYYLEGKAYSANETILANALLSFTLNEKVYEFNTDEKGNFNTKIYWVIPCKSGMSIAQSKKRIAELNPDRIHFNFKCQGTKIKNYWKEFTDASYNSEKENVMRLDLHFKN